MIETISLLPLRRTFENDACFADHGCHDISDYAQRFQRPGTALFRLPITQWRFGHEVSPRNQRFDEMMITSPFSTARSSARFTHLGEFRRRR